MEAPADFKLYVVQMIEFVYNRVENIVGKAENTGNFPFFRVVENPDCLIKC